MHFKKFQLSTVWALFMTFALSTCGQTQDTLLRSEGDGTSPTPLEDITQSAESIKEFVDNTAQEITTESSALVMSSLKALKDFEDLPENINWAQAVIYGVPDKPPSDDANPDVTQEDSPQAPKTPIPETARCVYLVVSNTPNNSTEPKTLTKYDLNAKGGGFSLSQIQRALRHPLGSSFAHGTFSAVVHGLSNHLSPNGKPSQPPSITINTPPWIPGPLLGAAQGTVAFASLALELMAQLIFAKPTQYAGNSLVRAPVLFDYDVNFKGAEYHISPSASGLFGYFLTLPFMYFKQPSSNDPWAKHPLVNTAIMAAIVLSQVLYDQHQRSILVHTLANTPEDPFPIDGTNNMQTLPFSALHPNEMPRAVRELLDATSLFPGTCQQ